MSEKSYRTAVVALLAIITLAQAYILFEGLATEVSEECQAAVAEANVILEDRTGQMLEQLSGYEEAVYERAQNISEQTFLAAEFQFIALQSLALEHSALVNITAKCR